MFRTLENIIRRSTHADTWYPDSSSILDNQLSDWLANSGPSVHGPARVIITPHAGYAYSGACAAHAYKEIDPNKTKRVFILGPTHYSPINGCALSKADFFQTPLYNLELDKLVNKELLDTGKFSDMSLSVDEGEHSIEMQFPYLAKVMQGKDFKIVPILVGSLNASTELVYGEIFSRYLANEENLFVISSDFCHWGERFDYVYYNRNWGHIYESIEKLDRMGMDIIQTCQANSFKNYLQKYKNTICGRNPILLILNTIQSLANKNQGLEFKLRFLNYAQSSKCTSSKDSSVSYAAASLLIVPK